MGNAEPKRVLIVGCGFPQLGLLRAAKELGLWVLGVDANRSAIGATVCDDFREVSTHDVDAVVRVAREMKVDGIMTCGSELAREVLVSCAPAVRVSRISPNRPATPMARRQQGVTCPRSPLVILVRRVPS